MVAAYACLPESLKNRTCHERLNWSSMKSDVDKLAKLASRAVDASVKICFLNVQVTLDGIRTYVYQGYPSAVPGACTRDDRATILNASVASVCLLGDAGTSCVFSWSDPAACGLTGWRGTDDGGADPMGDSSLVRSMDSPALHSVDPLQCSIMCGDVTSTNREWQRCVPGFFQWIKLYY